MRNWLHVGQAWQARTCSLTFLLVTSSTASPVSSGVLRSNCGRKPQWFEDRTGVLALAIYALLSFAFVGRSVATDLSSSYIGTSNDPSVYMWCLCWWPYAIAHRLDPMMPHVVWAPAGFDLAWTTAMPLPSLLASPFTRTFGPVVAYNLLCFLAPALAAWSAFLLCRHIVSDYFCGFAGGYVFGFSPYILGQVRGHLPLVLVFPLPLALLLVLQRIENRISRWWFSVALGVLLIVALLCWSELYATMTFFGAVAFGLATLYAQSDLRDRLRQLLIPILIAYALSLIVVLPYLYYFFQPGYPRVPINSPRAFAADLLNLVVPTPVNALGTISLIQDIARPFVINSLEATAYTGLPLLVIAIWFSRERWREAMAKALVIFLLVVYILMLGPRLHVGGIELFGMPWKIMLHVPMLYHALPARFSLYAFLALAVIFSMWLSAPRPSWLKFTVVALLAISFCPNMDAEFWRRKDDTPDFFIHGVYKRYLEPGENVVMLPYGIKGTTMLWQARSGFYFRMAGGWTSVTPHEFEKWPVLTAMLTRSYIPDITWQLRAFMATHGVRVVIVGDFDRQFWEPMLTPLDNAPIQVSGVAIYRAPVDDLKTYRSVSALEAERRFNLERFSTLLFAASRYLARNADLDRLTPLLAQRMRLLPANWVTEPDVRTKNGLYLGPWEGNTVAVGVAGSYLSLQPVIDRYRSVAQQIFLPFPKKYTRPPRPDSFVMLVMVFDRAGLMHATQSEPHPPSLTASPSSVYAAAE
jgi:hypothetical protein